MDFMFVENEDGSISRRIPLSEDMAEMLGQMREAFRQRHGREPGPRDRVFDGAPHQEVVEHGAEEAIVQVVLGYRVSLILNLQWELVRRRRCVYTIFLHLA